ncbi:hypothetical protein D3C72_1500750 [compost metagenome]
MYQRTACAGRMHSAPIRIKRTFFQLPNVSANGDFEARPSAFIFLNSGDSSSLRRIHSEMPNNRMETMKGMRQPHARNVSGPMVRRNGMMTATASRKPTAAVRITQAVHVARLLVGACSAT